MKYNDNGTIKEVKVKSFDTLPVGTEVDYNGSVVPDGWEEIDDFEIQIVEAVNKSHSSNNGTMTIYKDTNKKIAYFSLECVMVQTTTYPQMQFVTGLTPKIQYSQHFVCDSGINRIGIAELKTNGTFQIFSDGSDTTSSNIWRCNGVFLYD